MRTNTSKNDFIARAIPPVASTSIFLLALAFAPVIPIGAATIAILGGVSALTVGEYVYTKISRTKLDRYFEESGMISKSGEMPEVLEVKQTESGTRYKISLPAGYSTEDFEKRKLSIEQYIDAGINISYAGKHVYINTVDKKLQEFYQYEFIHTENPLEVCLGYGYGGHVFLDIEQAPHIIIGSETGGGKTTVLRNIITSLILKDGGVTLFLVDFQKVGLGIFKNCRNVQNFCGTISEFQSMLKVLKKEHDRRLNLFLKTGVDDVQHYNRKHNKKKLPYCVVIIDEFSELAREKNLLNQLMVRAAEDRKVGLHYIISTQRPSTSIVSGDIRANFPAAIALKVKDATNSRIILDEDGAERLRGKGHALLKQNGTMTELQSFAIESDEAMNLVKHTFIQKEKVVGMPHVAAKRPPCTPIY